MSRYSVSFQWNISVARVCQACFGTSCGINSTIDWSHAQYEKGGGLLSGKASERKSEPKYKMSFNSTTMNVRASPIGDAVQLARVETVINGGDLNGHVGMSGM